MPRILRPGGVVEWRHLHVILEKLGRGRRGCGQRGVGMDAWACGVDPVNSCVEWVRAEKRGLLGKTGWNQAATAWNVGFLGFRGTAEKCAAVTGAFHNVVPAAGDHRKGAAPRLNTERYQYSKFFGLLQAGEALARIFLLRQFEHAMIVRRRRLTNELIGGGFLLVWVSVSDGGVGDMLQSWRATQQPLIYCRAKEMPFVVKLTFGSRGVLRAADAMRPCVIAAGAPVGATSHHGDICTPAMMGDSGILKISLTTGFLPLREFCTGQLSKNSRRNLRRNILKQMNQMEAWLEIPYTGYWQAILADYTTHKQLKYRQASPVLVAYVVLSSSPERYPALYQESLVMLSREKYFIVCGKGMEIPLAAGTLGP
ncbi:hypothetical protein B0H14DRAFT_2610109 [Mycena olivaceomarginata]|nr:hypothetical protein B0H14DRAFT_2610109 [Mycena olivaceomarginata]